MFTSIDFLEKEQGNSSPALSLKPSTPALFNKNIVQATNISYIYNFKFVL